MDTPAKNRPRTRLEQREADIIEAATRLFASDGFHSTSTRRIAAEAGVSEGTVFNYFSTKNALLLAILDEFYARLTETSREGVERVMGTRERLLFLATNHLQQLLDKQALMIRLIQVYLSVDTNYYTDYRNTHMHRLNYQYTRIFDGVVREGIERGDLDPGLSLPACRDLFFGGLEYGMRTLLGKDNTANVANYVEQIVNPLWIGMLAPEARDNAHSEAVETEKRLEKACRRLEKAARRLEQAADRS